MISKSGFKAYDIRGKYPKEVNEILAYQVARAFVAIYNPKKIVLGRDIRLTSEALLNALAEGFQDGGCDVLDLGLCGTEQVYFATATCKAQGGIMVTASHNPMDYNGLKLVREEARPISQDTGLLDIYNRIKNSSFSVGLDQGKKRGTRTRIDSLPDYCEHLLSLVSPEKMKPLKVVMNAGNGCAGPVVDYLKAQLPLEVILMNGEPDGTFPNGIPNPLLLERREATAQAVVKHGADIGIAWDGDFDRCFLFDHRGRFIDSYYLVGFLAEIFLKKFPGATIIYDPRLVWNTEEIVTKSQGVPLESRGGHAFMKDTLRRVDAVYGGEASGHHFFKEFFYCDSGMLPWLYTIVELSRRNCTLASVVDEAMSRYPVSGEINRRVEEANTVIAKIENTYKADALKVEHLDGLSVEYPEWRFNLRTSNTEPLTRLNLETRGDQNLLQIKIEELLKELGGIAVDE